MLYNYLILYLYDEEYTKIRGINVALLRWVVYMMIPVGIIVLIRVVGIILTIALMTIPTSIAKLFFKSFVKVVISSIVISILFCVTGADRVLLRQHTFGRGHNHNKHRYYT